MVFAYNRARHLATVLAALAANRGAARSKLFIYCDGPRTRADELGVAAARNVARGAAGFLDVSVIERTENLGLSASIIRGVGEVCDLYGAAIVLEDDIVPTPFFLEYMNDALDRYADDERVLSIGCHTFDSGFDLPETFFLNVPDCWGWAVWKRSWALFNANGPALLAQINARGVARRFDFDGAYPYSRMLEEQVRGGNESWAVRWYAHAFLEEKLVLYPRRSVTSNIGFDGSGAHGGQPSGYHGVRMTDRRITVSSIDVQESALAREAWTIALREMALASRPGIGSAARSCLRRMYRPLTRYLRSILP